MCSRGEWYVHPWVNVHCGIPVAMYFMLVAIFPVATFFCFDRFTPWLFCLVVSDAIDFLGSFLALNPYVGVRIVACRCCRRVSDWVVVFWGLIAQVISR